MMNKMKDKPTVDHALAVISLLQSVNCDTANELELWLATLGLDAPKCVKKAIKARCAAAHLLSFSWQLAAVEPKKAEQLGNMRRFHDNDNDN